MENATIDVMDLTTTPEVLQDLSRTSITYLPSNQVLSEFEQADDKVRAQRAQLAALDRSLTKFRVSGLAARATSAKRPDRSRKEATATEIRQFYQDFAKAKQDEYKSWVDNDVLRYKDGNSLKCKAR